MPNPKIISITEKNGQTLNMEPDISRSSDARPLEDNRYSQIISGRTENDSLGDHNNIFERKMVRMRRAVGFADRGIRHRRAFDWKNNLVSVRY